MTLGYTAEPASAASLRPVEYDQITGWHADRHADALATFSRSCAKLLKSTRPMKIVGHKVSAKTIHKACRRALVMTSNGSERSARAFFEQYFAPHAVVSSPGDKGLFTGYFEPQYPGSRTRTLAYHVPLYRVPGDFKSARKPYLSRQQVEQGGLDGRGLELVYLNSAVDAFFTHVQGSARISLTDGSVMRVGFAAKNGHPYTAIGKVLIDRAALRRENVSMQTIRAWLEQNPAEAQQVMWRNRSFIFFRETGLRNPQLGPTGAQGVNLDALRSLAVDKSLYSYGIPMWLDTTLPAAAGSHAQTFQRLMVAQDTGSAIKGAIRADVFVGTGGTAGEIAGRMKQQGSLIVLVPRAQPLARQMQTDDAQPPPSGGKLK